MPALHSTTDRARTQVRSRRGGTFSSTRTTEPSRASQIRSSGKRIVNVCTDQRFGMCSAGRLRHRVELREALQAGGAGVRLGDPEPAGEVPAGQGVEALAASRCRTRSRRCRHRRGRRRRCRRRTAARPPEPPVDGRGRRRVGRGRRAAGRGVRLAARRAAAGRAWRGARGGGARRRGDATALARHAGGLGLLGGGAPAAALERAALGRGGGGALGGGVRGRWPSATGVGVVFWAVRWVFFDGDGDRPPESSETASTTSAIPVTA